MPDTFQARLAAHREREKSGLCRDGYFKADRSLVHGQTNLGWSGNFDPPQLPSSFYYALIGEDRHMTRKMCLISASIVALLSTASSFAQSSGPSVTVTNPSTNPVITRDNDNKARHPFTASCFNAGAAQGLICTIQSKPEETTVIETISVRSAITNMDTNMQLVSSLEAFTGKNPNVFWLNPMSIRTISPDVAGQVGLGSQNFHIYVDPNTTITCASQLFGLAAGEVGNFNMECLLSGYTVALP